MGFGRGPKGWWPKRARRVGARTQKKGGGKKGGGPKGWGPEPRRRVGARRVGARKGGGPNPEEGWGQEGWGPEGWEPQKFRAFFCFSRSHFHSCFSLWCSNANKITDNKFLLCHKHHLKLLMPSDDLDKVSICPAWQFKLLADSVCTETRSWPNKVVAKQGRGQSRSQPW